jgi:hypothetical protein
VLPFTIALRISDRGIQQYKSKTYASAHVCVCVWFLRVLVCDSPPGEREENQVCVCVYVCVCVCTRVSARGNVPLGCNVRLFL